MARWVIGPEAGSPSGWGFSDTLATRVEDIKPTEWTMWDGGQWLSSGNPESALSGVSFEPLATDAWSTIRRLWSAASAFRQQALPQAWPVADAQPPTTVIVVLNFPQPANARFVQRISFSRLPVAQAFIPVAESDMPVVPAVRI